MCCGPQIFNLLCSFTDPDAIDDAVNDKLKDDSDEGTASWLVEYQKGCDFEMYTTELADGFEGCKFSELSAALYLKLGIVLFGLRIKEARGKRVKVALNPADFIIPSKDKYVVEGFVIASNRAASDLSVMQVQKDVNSRLSHLALIAESVLKQSSESIMPKLSKHKLQLSSTQILILTNWVS